MFLFLWRYIQAATSPKDIVIIVDVSGSMKGLRMTIAKHTIVTILDTLGENDFVNIIAVSMSLVGMHWCYCLPFQDPGHDKNGLITQREPAPMNTKGNFFHDSQWDWGIVSQVRDKWLLTFSFLKLIQALPLSPGFPYESAKAQSPRYKIYFSWQLSHCVTWLETPVVTALSLYGWTEGEMNSVGR